MRKGVGSWAQGDIYQVWPQFIFFPLLVYDSLHYFTPFSVDFFQHYRDWLSVGVEDLHVELYWFPNTSFYILCCCWFLFYSRGPILGCCGSVLYTRRSNLEVYPCFESSWGFSHVLQAHGGHMKWGFIHLFFVWFSILFFFFLSFSICSTRFCSVPLFWLLPEMQPQVIHPKLLVVFRHWQMGATSKQFCELLDLKKDWLDDTIVGFDTSSPRRHDGEVKHENQSSRRKRVGTEWKRASLLRLVRCCLRRWGKLSCLYWQPSRCQSIHRGRCMWALWKQDSRGGSLEILHFGLHSFILGSICGRVG